MVSWFKRLFGGAETTAESPVVLGLAVQDAPKPIEGRALEFRGYRWVQQGGIDERGRLVFVREVAVDGRPVKTEVQVMADDLEETTDGTLTLRGRE